MASVNEDAIGVTELQQLQEAMANLTQCVRENAGRANLEEDAVSLGAAEKAVLEKVAAVSSAAMAATLAAWQPTTAEIEHEGRTWRRLGPASRGVYFGLHGPVVIDRHLYREVGVRNGATVVPLELRAGIVEGRWTPRAAEAVAHLAQALPSRDAAEIAATLGVLPYSRSSLHRCAEAVGSRWGVVAHEAEETLVQQMTIPEEAATLSVSVDRVSLPMEEPAPDDDENSDRKIQRVFRMAYCGVLTLHDNEGKPVGSVRYGRMPRDGRRVLEDSLSADVAALLQRRPDLSTVGLADGAAEMQHMLDRILAAHAPKAVALDKYHVLEKLADAVKATARDARSHVRSWKETLDVDDRAIERIETRLRTWSLDYDYDELPEALYDALTYIENNRERMRYASMRKAGLPVGSGHVEATCKTIVSVRMKRAGARWKEHSGQAILNLRSLACSHRWRPAMDITLGSYVHRLEPAARAA